MGGRHVIRGRPLRETVHSSTAGTVTFDPRMEQASPGASATAGGCSMGGELGRAAGGADRRRSWGMSIQDYAEVVCAV